jgi:hypothetical protein
MTQQFTPLDLSISTLLTVDLNQNTGDVHFTLNMSRDNALLLRAFLTDHMQILLAPGDTTMPLLQVPDRKASTKPDLTKPDASDMKTAILKRWPFKRNREEFSITRLEKAKKFVLSIVLPIVLVFCLIAFPLVACSAKDTSALTANPTTNSGYVAPPVHCESGLVQPLLRLTHSNNRSDHHVPTN